MCKYDRISKKKAKAKGKTINDICRELAEYNRKNGTCMSYGDFVNMKGY